MQEHFRLVFKAWGRPERLRVDNGSPWGNTSDLPPDLALWLYGLDVDLLWNPPRRPQYNGVVERSQGVGKNWAEPERCHSIRELQRRIDREDQVQRELYPSIAGQSRLSAYPQLRRNERRYSLAWERRNWNFRRMSELLALSVAHRRVDSAGKIGLYHHKVYVGTKHQGLLVNVQFDPERHDWLISDEKDRHLQRVPADMITPERVRGLKVSKR